MDSDEMEDLKEKINQFIWQNGPDSMTLVDAERAAVQLLHALRPVPGPPDPPRPAERTEIG